MVRHVINSAVDDLSLSSDTNFNALEIINLTGSSFEKFPKILYERNYSADPGFAVDLSVLNPKAILSSSEYANLRSNVEDLTACLYTRLQNGLYSVECGSSSNSTSSSASSSSTEDNATVGSGSDSSNSDAGDSSGGVSTGVLVVIIVLVVVITAVLAFFIFRTCMRRKAADASANNYEATATLMGKGDASADKGSFISNDEFLRNFRLPQSDVALVKSLGTGRLWMGEYNGNKVVVKRVESEVTDSYVTKALMAQARTFATISHPNITSLVGVTWLAGTDFAVVTEFMDKGNLKSVLANSDVDLDITIKLQMCCDVALGLAYLHETEQNLCAKQLSSRKVLVNKAMNCKLSLFECVPSSAKLGGPSGAATYSYGMGEIAWLPPEVIRRSSPMDARKNNIYAFGVLVCEIFTRVTPYQSLVENLGNTMSDVELVKRVRREEQLVPHENRQEFLAAPASVQQMVEKCLSYAPMSRPTAKDLVEILHGAKEELATNSI
ncbi:putative serine/threonine-protein kinase drkB [Phytophthora citrophthora]|uniref:Serine/threonine-protein kinase drkB n=1 Tax=Phytophthora citrophthora TaxID=4793 RepID=A0AAD9G9X2_9STRA|nr:putative serine/threonine-protein kinase drkB [Phytophthora citrophthora]